MIRHYRWLVAWSAVLLGAGCDDEPRTAPDAAAVALEVRGYAAMVLVDGMPRPAFDAQHQPRLVTPSLARWTEARWVPDAGPVVLLAQAEWGSDPGKAAELRPFGEVVPGPGRIEVGGEFEGWSSVSAYWIDPVLESRLLFAGPAIQMARDAMSASRRGGAEHAIDGMLAASGQWLMAGRVSEASNCLGAAAHYARRRNDLPRSAELERWNQALIEATDDRPAQLASLYRQALLDKQLGRFRAAEEHLLVAGDGMRRSGLERHARAIERARGNLLGRLGRHAEAVAIHDTAPIPDHDPEAAFRARLNRAWARLLAMRAGAIPADYAAVLRAFADEAERMPGSLSPASSANLHVNLALAALLSGAHPQAREALERARTLDPDGGGLWPAFLDLLEGELALVEHRPHVARRAFGRAADSARRAVGGGDSIEAWQALYGDGRAAMAAGDTGDALHLWRSALAMTRRLAGRTPLSSSHSAFLADRVALVDDLVGLLLQRGEIGEAFRALDAARAPTLRALAADARLDGLDPAALAEWRHRVSAWGAAREAATQAEADAELAPTSERERALRRVEAARQLTQRRFDDAFGWLDQHAPLDAGDPGEPTSLVPVDTALLSFASIDGRWHGFLVAGGTIEHRPITDATDPIGPWRGILQARRRVYVIDGGLPAVRALAAQPVDPEDTRGLIWGEAVELTWLPYAGWLRGRARSLPTGPALVVADPDGTLPGSRRVAEAIARRGGIELLAGGHATRDAVLARLDGARWFHFDGHGVIGRDEPWHAHLRMARDERLSLADVLALRPRIGTVVLSGCETAAPEALSRSESLGLAEGFLLAGAAQVVAADRVLGVDEAARFVDAFHRRGGAEHPARAMKAVIADMRVSGDDAWHGWRVFGGPPGL